MLKAIAKRVDSWRTYNQTVRELSNLDNRTLKDLGITRDEIQSLAKRTVTRNL
jgi:uncharacterized protein YjiS (DUF1127 family)